MDGANVSQAGAPLAVKQPRELSSAMLLALLLAVFLLAWETVSLTGLWLRDLFPSPFAVVLEAWRQIVSGTLTPHLLTSAAQVGLGLSIGGSAGLVVGTALGVSQMLERVVEPLLHYCACVPKIIIYPISLWFLGIGMASKVAQGALASFFPIMINTAASVRAVKPIHIEAARLLGASGLKLYTKVYLPAMAGHLLVGLRLGMGVAIISTLIAETKLAEKGIGYLTIEYFAQFRITEMYALLLIIFTAAMVLNWLLLRVERRVGRYRIATETDSTYF